MESAAWFSPWPIVFSRQLLCLTNWLFWNSLQETHTDILFLLISSINVFAVTTAAFSRSPGLVWRAAGPGAVRGAPLPPRLLHPGLWARPLRAFKPRGSQSAQSVLLPAANQHRGRPLRPLSNLRSVSQQALCVCPGNISQPMGAHSSWVAGAATNPNRTRAQCCRKGRASERGISRPWRMRGRLTAGRWGRQPMGGDVSAAARFLNWRRPLMADGGGRHRRWGGTGAGGAGGSPGAGPVCRAPVGAPGPGAVPGLLRPPTALLGQGGAPAPAAPAGAWGGGGPSSWPGLACPGPLPCRALGSLPGWFLGRDVEAWEVFTVLSLLYQTCFGLWVVCVLQALHKLLGGHFWVMLWGRWLCLKPVVMVFWLLLFRWGKTVVFVSVCAACSPLYPGTFSPQV